MKLSAYARRERLAITGVSIIYETFHTQHHY
jgi:hypothetical protein